MHITQPTEGSMLMAQLSVMPRLPHSLHLLFASSHSSPAQLGATAAPTQPRTESTSVPEGCLLLLISRLRC